MSVHTEAAPDWERIDRELTAPFAVEDIDFRPQGRLGTDGKGRVVGYIDARAVQERLDRVVGREHWSFTWEAILMDKHIRVVKGILIIHGVRKEDVGDSVDNPTEPTKTAVSDAEKRVAVQWGIGRELYGMRLPRVQGKQDPNKPDNWTISEDGYRVLETWLAQHGTPRTQQAAPPAQPTNGHTQTPAQAAYSEAVRTADFSPSAEAAPMATPDQGTVINDLFTALRWTKEGRAGYLSKNYSVTRIGALTQAQAAAAIADLQARVPA